MHTGYENYSTELRYDEQNMPALSQILRQASQQISFNTKLQ